MTGRRGASGVRQVGSLLAALGVGAGLVAVLAVVDPDLARLPVAEGEGAQLVEAWRSGGSAAVEPVPDDGVEPTPDDSGSPSPKPSVSADDATETETEPSADSEGAAGNGSTDEAQDAGTSRDEDDVEPDAAGGPADEPVDEPAEQPDGPAAEVLALVNAERASAGCGALAADPALDALAAAHSADMRGRGYFSHTDPDGRTPWDRAEAAGLDGVAAENIARGQPDAAAVVDAWMNSPGHRANILDCGLTRHGLGVAHGSGGPWWTQVFGR